MVMTSRIRRDSNEEVGQKQVEEEPRLSTAKPWHSLKERPDLENIKASLLLYTTPADLEAA